MKEPYYPRIWWYSNDEDLVELTLQPEATFYLALDELRVLQNKINMFLANYDLHDIFDNLGH